MYSEGPMADGPDATQRYPPAPVSEPSQQPAFLLCVEHGRLESEAILLVESLRKWGGSYADAPVYAFAPAARLPARAGDGRTPHGARL